MTVGSPTEVVKLQKYVAPPPNPGEQTVTIDFVGSKAEIEKVVALGEPESKSISPITHLNDALLSQLDLPAKE